jgi:hypothetical protein
MLWRPLQTALPQKRPKGRKGRRRGDILLVVVAAASASASPRGEGSPAARIYTRIDIRLPY